MLSDLRESGSLEQDADIVVLVHRPDLSDQENEERLDELARLTELLEAFAADHTRLSLLDQDLRRRLEDRRILHARDVERGVARVELPDALERKYPRAAQQFAWHS